MIKMEMVPEKVETQGENNYLLPLLAQSKVKSSAICFINEMREGMNLPSRVRREEALFATYALAIKARLNFDIDDARRIWSSSYYMSAGWRIEETYKLACQAKNLSYCQSYEKKVGRKPFIASYQTMMTPWSTHRQFSRKQRLYIGYIFFAIHNGKRKVGYQDPQEETQAYHKWTVTSFNDLTKTVTLVTNKDADVLLAMDRLSDHKRISRIEARVSLSPRELKMFVNFEGDLAKWRTQIAEYRAEQRAKDAKRPKKHRDPIFPVE